MIKLKLGDTIRYIDYDKIDYFDFDTTRFKPATFIRWHDERNIVVTIDGVEKMVSSEYLM